MLVFTPQFFNLTIEKKERPFGQPKKKKERRNKWTKKENDTKNLLLFLK